MAAAANNLFHQNKSFRRKLKLGIWIKARMLNDKITPNYISSVDSPDLGCTELNSYQKLKAPLKIQTQPEISGFCRFFWWHACKVLGPINICGNII